MERSLRKRSTAARVGKNNIQQMMQMKPEKPKAEQQCKHEEGGADLPIFKKEFCKGYNHLDLSNTNSIKTVAVYYLKRDIVYDDEEMLQLSNRLRYDVKDTACPAAPLFEAKDISIQQVAMDALGKKEEWVLVINLNIQDENGYLRSELPFCEEKTYLIGAKVNVRAYVDSTNYCGKIADYKTCKNKCVTECRTARTGKGKISLKDCDSECSGKIITLKNEFKKDYSKDVVLTGTQYTIKDAHVSRRRRLLKHHRGRC
eukprot:g9231.t1